MTADKPEPMPLAHRLFGAIRKSDSAPIALIEARDEREAAARATDVLERLGGWDEVKVVEVPAGEGSALRVPTFLDVYFRAVGPASSTH